MMLGAIILPISLFILAFTSYPGIIWVGPCAAGVLFGFSMVIIYISANSVSPALCLTCSSPATTYK
jgi:hypothetical protein